MPARLPGWRGRLVALVGRHRGIAFAWGTADCGLFAAAAVEAITGVDPADGLRGTYDSRAGAKKALKARGYRSHVDMAAAALPETDPARLRTGDIALVKDGRNRALGVVTGESIAVLTPAGLGFLPLSAAIRGFRVG